ncbi:unnamed protein product [Lota lota]
MGGEYMMLLMITKKCLELCTSLSEMTSWMVPQRFCAAPVSCPITAPPSQSRAEPGQRLLHPPPCRFYLRRRIASSTAAAKS